MSHEKKIVALCSSRVYDPQVHGFIETLNEILRKEDFSLWIFSLNSDLYWEEDHLTAETSVFDYIPFNRVDIIVLMDEKIKSHRVAEKIISGAKLFEKPVIVLDGYYDGCDSISFDFAAGFERLVRHVFEDHEVKRPHFMAGIHNNPFSEERLEIFRKVAGENGFTVDEDMISYGDFWALPARAATEKILKRSELPDAIICANDIMAINVVDVLREGGVSVPDQVIVTGFDGYDEALLCTPGITTVNCELGEMAGKTAELIMGRLAGEEGGSVRVEPALLKNESCGCPRCLGARQSTMGRFNSGFYRFQDDFHEMHIAVTRMVMANDLEEGFRYLRGKYASEASCVVKEGCLRKESNFFLSEGGGDVYVLAYDADQSLPVGGRIEKDVIIPHLEERMESGYPLIFQALHFMDKPMGYMVFFFESYEITDYAKMGSVAETVGMGLGAYINMLHQRYLMSKVEKMYRYDALTGLYNRLAFQTAFELLKNDEKRKGQPLLIVMADLDRLKKINDTRGHNAGDAAIAAVGSALKDACPEEALCVRFGGDELLAFMPGLEDDSEILEKMRRSLEEKSRENGFEITASCGSCRAVISPELNLEELVREADEKMYQVKKARKEREGLG
ncbi:MAG: GGDEF domain-containing protein [Lachnospiraceae bacterium]|nr:GGDEF domain-containing protein [Lachnospiraceae bacterium]